MRMDVDSLLLDRLFQPVADRSADWITCFGLARLSLAAAVLLQFLILAIDLRSFDGPMARVAATCITLLALFGGRQAWSMIARIERQSRAGQMNVRRISLRWQRLAWLAVTAWSVATSASGGGEAGLEICGASLAWLGLTYFVSCTPAPPPARTMSRQVFA